MTKFNNSRVFIATAAFAAVATLSAFSFGGSAEASGNPLSCQGQTAKKVVACCEQMTKTRSPHWMQTTGTSCRQAVRCYQTMSLAMVAYPCHIAMIIDNHNDKNGGGRQRGLK